MERSSHHPIEACLTTAQEFRFCELSMPLRLRSEEGSAGCLVSTVVLYHLAHPDFGQGFDLVALLLADLFPGEALLKPVLQLFLKLNAFISNLLRRVLVRIPVEVEGEIDVTSAQHRYP